MLLSYNLFCSVMDCLFNVIFIPYLGIDYKWNICEKDEYLKEVMKLYDLMNIFFHCSSYFLYISVLKN